MKHSITQSSQSLSQRALGIPIVALDVSSRWIRVVKVLLSGRARRARKPSVVRVRLCVGVGDDGDDDDDDDDGRGATGVGGTEGVRGVVWKRRVGFINGGGDDDDDAKERRVRKTIARKDQ